MVVRVLAGVNRHRDTVLAYEVMRQADVVEIVHFEHDVIETALLRTYAEGDGVIAVVTMHEDGRDGAIPHANFVFDPSAHSQLHVKPPRRGCVILANYAMAQAAGPRIKAPVHSTSRIEGFAELNFRSVKNFNWIAARVFHLQDFKDMTFDRFVIGAEAIFDAGLG